ncbi:hypothetical protein D3C73_1590580 [compost metagenome]
MGSIQQIDNVYSRRMSRAVNEIEPAVVRVIFDNFSHAAVFTGHAYGIPADLGDADLILNLLCSRPYLQVQGT